MPQPDFMSTGSCEIVRRRSPGRAARGGTPREPESTRLHSALCDQSNTGPQRRTAAAALRVPSVPLLPGHAAARTTRARGCQQAATRGPRGPSFAARKGTGQLVQLRRRRRDPALLGRVSGGVVPVASQLTGHPHARSLPPLFRPRRGSFAARPNLGWPPRSRQRHLSIRRIVANGQWVPTEPRRNSAREAVGLVWGRIDKHWMKGLDLKLNPGVIADLAAHVSGSVPATLPRLGELPAVGSPTRRHVLGVPSGGLHGRGQSCHGHADQDETHNQLGTRQSINPCR